MTGPKHLWSGEWERETFAAHRAEPGPAQTPPQASDAPAEALRPSGRRRTAALIALAAVALAGAAVAGAALTGGEDSHAGQTVAAVAPPTQTTPNGTLQIPNFAPGTTPQPTIPAPQTTPPGQTQTAPAPQARPVPAAGPTVRWNGMEIVTTGVGDVVVSTVDLNSSAEQVGVQPGDQILSVNGRSLNTAGDIAGAVKGLPADRQIAVQLVNGSSSPRTVQLNVGAPPSRQS